VIAGFVALLATAGVLLLPGKHFGLWIATIIVLVAALIVVCLVKGERPHWRWGKD
jgi:hypothetical protein